MDQNCSIVNLRVIRIVGESCSFRYFEQNTVYNNFEMHMTFRSKNHREANRYPALFLNGGAARAIHFVELYLNVITP